MLQIQTAQYNYSGPDRLDITVKIGNKTFSPTWRMVMQYKRGIISEEDNTGILVQGSCHF